MSYSRSDVLRVIRAGASPLRITQDQGKPITVARYKQNRRRDVVLHPAVRALSMHVLGVTGTGKTKFLEGMLRQDILQGHGLVLFDPQGNLYNDLVKWLVQTGIIDTARVVLIDPNQTDYAVGYNPLALEEGRGDPGAIKAVVDTVLDAFSSAMGGENHDAMPTFVNIMNHVLYVLAEQGLTLNEAQYMVHHHDSLRPYLSARSANPLVAGAWADFNQLNNRDFRTHFLSSINRVERFLLSPTMQRMFAQTENRVDLGQAMDDGKVVLVNLNALTPGYSAQDAALLGRILLNDLTRRAKRRVRRDNDHPRPFYCYIDECHRYLSDDVARGLDELRQFGLRFVLSHQTLGQLRAVGESIYDSVIANAQVKVYFRLSRENAATVAPAAFVGQIDYQKVKEAFLSPTVTSYIREEFLSRTDGETTGGARSDTTGSVSGEARGVSSGLAVRDVDTGIFGLGDTPAPIVSEGESSSSVSSSIESHTEAESWASTFSETRSMQLVPELTWLPTTGYSMDEQYNVFADALSVLPQRHAMLVLPAKMSFEIVAADVSPALCGDERMTRAVARYVSASESPYTACAEVDAHVARRVEQLRQRATGGASEDELPDDDRWH